MVRIVLGSVFRKMVMLQMQSDRQQEGGDKYGSRLQRTRGSMNWVDTVIYGKEKVFRATIKEAEDFGEPSVFTDVIIRR